ncbi:unnamed protein product [Sordaria macrospora k-hell]|uniref:WGS project CABT00000000 data, contig 2.5 n=1 Tax=Sordaria macrospora (strain ATCC MYA-333 / DSM 997 / K(L3346) / K-hell) TaxID=771870 RepID=F7VRI6_SORMK|nr:uncharacterized protein SMAC_01671 [Sordaria macrospora k-hell]CCC08121.1 unnamed protein product [Sordaria macrospora k-hell]
MHLPSRTAWSLLLSLISLGTVADAADSGIIEVDLLFPRNETYAPTDPLIEYRGWNTSDFGQNGFSYTHDNIKWVNWSSQDPYFVHNFRNDLRSEGTWRLDWKVFYVSCNERWKNLQSVGDPVLVNMTSRSITFTIKEGGQAVDLVAATANDKTCSDESIAAIKITGKTQSVPHREELPDNTCAVVGSPEPSASPCQVKVDSAVAASMTASLRANCATPYAP